MTERLHAGQMFSYLGFEAVKLLRISPCELAIRDNTNRNMVFLPFNVQTASATPKSTQLDTNMLTFEIHGQLTLEFVITSMHTSNVVVVELVITSRLRMLSSVGSGQKKTYLTKSIDGLDSSRGRLRAWCTSVVMQRWKSNSKPSRWFIRLSTSKPD